jgi:hypothetical protein
MNARRMVLHDPDSTQALCCTYNPDSTGSELKSARGTRGHLSCSGLPACGVELTWSGQPCAVHVSKHLLGIPKHLLSIPKHLLSIPEHFLGSPKHFLCNSYVFLSTSKLLLSMFCIPKHFRMYS